MTATVVVGVAVEVTATVVVGAAVEVTATVVVGVAVEVTATVVVGVAVEVTWVVVVGAAVDVTWVVVVGAAVDVTTTVVVGAAVEATATVVGRVVTVGTLAVVVPDTAPVLVGVAALVELVRPGPVVDETHVLSTHILAPQSAQNPGEPQSKLVPQQGARQTMFWKQTWPCASQLWHTSEPQLRAVPAQPAVGAVVAAVVVRETLPLFHPGTYAPMSRLE